MRHLLLLACCAMLAACASSYTEAKLTQPAYDGEDADMQVAQTSQIRRGNMEAPTPTAVQGASTVTTPQLRTMMMEAKPPVLIDVLGGIVTDSLPGAIWLDNGGSGRSFLQPKFKDTLASLTDNDPARRIVFFCLSKTCWLSHNAAVRAVSLGYTQVYWYRGGRNAWIAAGLNLEPIKKHITL